VLQMREGERALIHVPSTLGYGAAPQGSKGGAWYIPGNSNLLFDIEIVSKAGARVAAKEL
jgi:FKBP-type peptidyl-prolyl cis-trans isomerase